jgi:hypothetical protein
LIATAPATPTPVEAGRPASLIMMSARHPLPGHLIGRVYDWNRPRVTIEPATAKVQTDPSLRAVTSTGPETSRRTPAAGGAASMARAPAIARVFRSRSVTITVTPMPMPLPAGERASRVDDRLERVGVDPRATAGDGRAVGQVGEGVAAMADESEGAVHRDLLGASAGLAESEQEDGLLGEQREAAGRPGVDLRARGDQCLGRVVDDGHEQGPAEALGVARRAGRDQREQGLLLEQAAGVDELLVIAGQHGDDLRVAGDVGVGVRGRRPPGRVLVEPRAGADGRDGVVVEREDHEGAGDAEVLPLAMLRLQALTCCETRLAAPSRNVSASSGPWLRRAPDSSPTDSGNSSSRPRNG